MAESSSDLTLILFLVGALGLLFIVFLVGFFNAAKSDNKTAQIIYEKKRSIQSEYELLQLGMSFEDVQNTLSTLKYIQPQLTSEKQKANGSIVREYKWKTGFGYNSTFLGSESSFGNYSRESCIKTTFENDKLVSRSEEGIYQ